MNLVNRLTTPSDRSRFICFAVFISIVFLIGGGSRDDIQSLILLRPLAVFFAAYALIVMRPGDFGKISFLFYLLCALGAVHILQLIPLPPSIWSELPQREIFVQIADTAGIEQPWRPISLSPSKTLNSFFSLFVPLAVLLLFSLQNAKYYKHILTFLIGICLVSSLVGIIQKAGPQANAFYFYRYTNLGEPVGLFANTNHQMLLLSIAIAMLGWFAASASTIVKSLPTRIVISIFAIMLITALVWSSGSRAGIFYSAIAMVIAALFIYSTRRKPRSAEREGSKAKLDFGKFAIFLFIPLIFLALLLLVSGSQASSFDQLLANDPLQELRYLLLPILSRMAIDFFWFGSGFGSFEHVFKHYENTDVMRQSYLNQAHNDWMQFAIEGGVFAIAIYLVFVIWIIRVIIKTFFGRGSSDSSNDKKAAIIALFAIFLFALGSIVDYPLRVPSLMAVFAIFCAILYNAASNEHEGKTARRRVGDK